MSSRFLGGLLIGPGPDDLELAGPIVLDAAPDVAEIDERDVLPVQREGAGDAAAIEKSAIAGVAA